MASNTATTHSGPEGGAFDATGVPLRVITAASLFDGHDAAINVMRRLIQAAGCEVIHLGHDRSALDVVKAAIEEDAHAVALTSYQGGHMEYFTYIRELLDAAGRPDIKIFGGGGGTITPPEIRDLHAAGITRIYSPDDGRQMGLLGMIDNLVSLASEYDLMSGPSNLDGPVTPEKREKVARLISFAENEDPVKFAQMLKTCRSRPIESRVPVIGFTGTGGAGKSSLLDELMRRITTQNPELNIALLCTDPTRKRTGGALLGDRIRMNSLTSDRIFMRSLASRTSGKEISDKTREAIEVCQAVGYDLIFVETSGIGQGSDAITEVSDISLYVMTSEFGAHTQLEKIEMLDVADIVILNKFEKRGAEDALRAIRKQVKRNRNLFDLDDSSLPVVPTIASQFADPGVDLLWERLAALLVERNNMVLAAMMPNLPESGMPEPKHIIPPERIHYLADISRTIRDYHSRTNEMTQKVRLVQQLEATATHMAGLADGTGSTLSMGAASAVADIRMQAEEIRNTIHPIVWKMIAEHEDRVKQYRSGTYTYQVRGRDFSVNTTTKSLAHTAIPRVALPNFADAGDLLGWLRCENVPGSFPYTSGVFPFKREDELPTRMFAGEGPASRTNKRFHYLSKGEDYARLSTAFDSVTLYGRDPHTRPDIYGKVGESGVSIYTVDEISTLFDGFDLCGSNTSVSMTINGPAAIILAMFFNAAIRQQVAKFRGEKNRDPNEDEYNEISRHTLQTVRGTVQADILKEDQAQNTCIFSTEFSLKLMGDVQQFYIDNSIRNHYSVSISGYHIAEAGANPISQLAFTLANGFTYVEYYRSRGMKIDDFAPNLSFFFSNGLDPEYTVIGRVARRIWAVAMRDLYGGNERSQKLKYHIQTSGRSLHAQEIDFNDIRTTLQALLAIQDQANSLHTNAYDEAITTPTEESVRRALAVQLIVNKESGWTKTENTLQGSFIVDELTELVEEAVLAEFERIAERGGVLGAMETMYQRGKIQDESLYYEEQKHSGELPITGVNFFENPNAASFDESSADDFNMELARATPEEKQGCLSRLAQFHKEHEKETPEALDRLQQVARTGGNVFAELMETVKVASLGQITDALFEVGGQYRRNM
ncbi:MAG: methylmalonyl-CoA mutase family protein [Candidatus Thalassarchaeaceae archaeon]|nr:methylmalonyl-CoA mutase family protein [Candidatus Thalassarchaeaceae archaeon]